MSVIVNIGRAVALLSLLTQACSSDPAAAPDGAGGTSTEATQPPASTVRPGGPGGGADMDAGEHSPASPPVAPLPPPVPYTNPVYGVDFADPAVIRGKDRKLYAFATGGLIQRARSTDLVHWQGIGNALVAKPSWASNKNNFWAPHVSEHGGTYYLYFSAEQNAGSGSFCIGVATGSAPDAPFTDSGQPIACGPSFANIDPMQYDDPKTGQPLLYWGSAFEAIRVQELTADRLRLAPGSQPRALLTPSAYAYERLIEGAWLHKHGDTFYLFSSGDDCCGSANAAPHYAVMVARSKSPTGPFEDYAPSVGAPDNTILVGSNRFYAPGHNAVIVDDAGTEWMVYHSFDRGTPGPRRMLIDPIVYKNGWPTIANRVPSEVMQPKGPVFSP